MSKTENNQQRRKRQNAGHSSQKNIRTLKNAHTLTSIELRWEKFHDLNPASLATKRILLINLVAPGNGKHGK